LAKEITKIVEEIRELGPLNWPRNQVHSNGAGAPAIEVVEEVAA
jgi:hypothetical protein